MEGDPKKTKKRNWKDEGIFKIFVKKLKMVFSFFYNKSRPSH